MGISLAMCLLYPRSCTFRKTRSPIMQHQDQCDDQKLAPELHHWSLAEKFRVISVMARAISVRRQLVFLRSTGWWFQTFFIFHNIWDNPSYCLIFFRGVETTNQIKHGWKIPVRWYINPQEHLQKLLDDAGFSGSYDFLYLPMKFISKLPFGHSKKTTAQTGPWQKNDQQIRYQQGYHSPVCRLTFWTILGFRYATEHPVICQPYTISVSVKGE